MIQSHPGGQKKLNRRTSINNDSWNLKSRCKDLVFKLISFTSLWAIIATILLVFSFISDNVWLGFMSACIFTRQGVKIMKEYKNGNNINNNPNEEKEA